MNESEALKLAVEAAQAAQMAAEKVADEAPGFLDYLKFADGLAGTVFLWVLLITFLLLLLFKRRETLGFLQNIRSVKAMGFEVEIAAEKELTKAIKGDFGSDYRIRKTVTGKIKRITEEDEKRVIQRAVDLEKALRDRRLLWVDDNLKNNLHEHSVFNKLGVEVTQVLTNEDALEMLQRQDLTFHVVVSDIKRPGDDKAGLNLLLLLQDHEISLPVIYYITEIKEGAPLPLGAFGLTNQPDELIHLVCDALERCRSVA